MFNIPTVDDLRNMIYYVFIESYNLLEFLIESSLVIEIIIILFGIVFFAWKIKILVWHKILGSVIARKIREKEDCNRNLMSILESIIDQCENKLIEDSRPLNDVEINSIIDASYKIYLYSRQANNEAATLSFLFYRCCRVITGFNSEGAYTIIVSSDLYKFLYLSANLIKEYTENNIEIPYNISVQYEETIKKTMRRYVKGHKRRSVPGIGRKINLESNSSLVIIFYDRILSKFSPESLGGAHKEFFKSIHDNSLMVFIMNYYKVYFPIKIHGIDDFLFGNKHHLKLTSIMRKRSLDFENGKTEYCFDLYYTNTHPIVSFVGGNYHRIIGQNFFDGEGISNKDFINGIKNISYVGNETLKINISESIGKKEYYHTIVPIEKYLCKKNDYSFMYCSFRYILSVLRFVYEYFLCDIYKKGANIVKKGSDSLRVTFSRAKK